MSDKKSNLQKIFQFADFLNKFRDVERILLKNGSDRYENDVEHSYMLAMLADYIISLENLKLDRNKVLEYCLVHDLVEAYAGDTYIYSTDKEYIDSKHRREKEALEKIKIEFPEHQILIRTIEKYEVRLDEESRFVYALDKIQPVIHIYLDGGKTWKKERIGLDDLIKHKKDKVKFSPIVQKYWNELREILERNQHTLFSH